MPTKSFRCYEHAHIGRQPIADWSRSKRHCPFGIADAKGALQVSIKYFTIIYGCSMPPPRAGCAHARWFIPSAFPIILPHINRCPQSYTALNAPWFSMLLDAYSYNLSVFVAFSWRTSLSRHKIVTRRIIKRDISRAP